MGSGGRDDQYGVLKWKDYHVTVASSFKMLKDEEDFLDVTLVCDEESQLSAHKVMLSACSPYFRTLLRKSKNPHPTLIMPDNVRFQDLASLIDFMYLGEVTVPHEDLPLFMALAKQFKVRGLSDYGPTGEKKKSKSMMQGRGLGGPASGMPAPAGIHSDIRQRLPPGIQMVPQMKRAQAEGSPQKRPRLGPGPKAHMGAGAHMGHYPAEEEEEEDDITEIREGDDSNDYYDENYPQEQYPDHTGYEEEPAAQEEVAPGGAAPSGPQLMGLLCPKCRTMCQGVQALKEHMQVCNGVPTRGPSQGPAGGAHHGTEEEPQVCQICDKSFKSHRTLDNHMKKQHGLAGTPKGRGRPKKPQGVAGWGHGDGSTEYQTMSAEGSSKGRPVGQVAPAQRSTDIPGGAGVGSKQGDGKGEGPSRSEGRGRGSPRGMARGGLPMARGYPMGRARGKDGEPKPDLQKLGMKFGGQISITSTGNQAKKSNRGDNDGQGVSVTKLKGDVPVGGPVSIKDAKGKEKGEASKAGEAESTVKEEPKDFEEGDGGVGEGQEGEGEAGVDQDDFGNYDGGDFGPGEDGLYGEEGDYHEGDVDQEGMDIEYFSQYKGGDREEFDGRTGMFQGEYGEGEHDMEGEGEYEEEA